MKRFDLKRYKASIDEQRRSAGNEDNFLTKSSVRITYGGYHRAAAVLSTFDSKTLKPVEGIDNEEGIEDVLANSTLVEEVGKGPRWALLPHVRRDILRQMNSREALARARSANPERRNDPIQRMLDAYVRGSAPRLDQQNAEEVAGTFQVAQWLGDVLESVPSLDAIRERHEWLSLLQPFEMLAGTSRFRGREYELQKLRDYVGVLPPGSFRERFRRTAAWATRQEKEPTFVIYGAGGVGKSALIARFIFEHATLPNAQRFPWAYIDFDRPGVHIEEPLTILVEAVSQLGIQYPAARKYCDSIRRDWQHYLSRDSLDPGLAAVETGPDILAAGVSPPGKWHEFLRDFAILLDRLKANTAPFLLALDTFEEVQQRGNLSVGFLTEFLSAFQQHVPRLRTVLAGRAQVTGTPYFATQGLHLEDFDPQAAQAFLEHRGVRPSAAASMLVKQFGGNPLVLVLAEAAWRDGVTDEQGRMGDLPTSGLFGWFSLVTEAEIQGFLYTRILDHIQDGDLKKLAHPGLVLRRITPELIREVLAEPCGVHVGDLSDARFLYDKMKNQVALVSEEDGGLRQRSDLRRIMLRLLREDKPDKVQQIQKAAVAYYQQRNGIVDRAEEIYHRLALKQPLAAIEERWIEGVEQYLGNAREELDIHERAWLTSRLGLSLTPEEREEADLEAWERDTGRRVRELVRQGLLGAARVALRERTNRVPGSSLYLLEAQVLELLESWLEARTIIGQGIASASVSGNTALAIDLRLHGAKIDVRLHDLEEAELKLDAAETLALRRGTYHVRLLEIGLSRLALRRTVGDNAEAIRPLYEQLRHRFLNLSDEQVFEQPILMGWLASELLGRYPEVMQRVARLSGIQTERVALLRALGLALAAWDDRLSRREGQRSGMLGRRIGLRGRGTLIDVWTSFTLKASPTELNRTITQLLNSSSPVPSDVWGAIAAILWDRAQKVAAPGSVLGALPSSAGPTRLRPSGSSTTDSSVGRTLTQVRFSDLDVPQLQEALRDAFQTRQALAQMVKHRLDRSLEVIALSDDLDRSLADLIGASQEGRWSAQLLVAAREARPESAPLLVFSERYGLAPTLVPARSLGLALREAHSPLDETLWRARLGRLETQVCRIELEGPGVPILGMGFLIGPNLLLTTYGVVEPIHRGSIDPLDVALRFDYKRMVNGVEMSQGTVYRLDTEWLAAHEPSVSVDDANAMAPASGLDFALLRTAGSPGAGPVGGAQAEPDSDPRGWMEIRSDAADLRTGASLVILYYGRDGRLRVSMQTPGVSRLDTDGTHLSYTNKVDGGLAGCPCFTSGLDTVALHQGTSASGGEGVPLPAILGRLRIDESGDLPGSTAGFSQFYP